MKRVGGWVASIQKKQIAPSTECRFELAQYLMLIYKHFIPKTFLQQVPFHYQGFPPVLLPKLCKVLVVASEQAVLDGVVLNPT